METKNNKVFIIGIVVLIGIVVGYAVYSGVFGKVNITLTKGDGVMMENIDKNFIISMIPHHQGAIDMAKLALSRSKNPEIINLSKNIIEAQEKENKDMRAWYKEWFDSDVPVVDKPMMRMEGMVGNPEVLATVSDAKFDEEFLNQMIIHHEMAIMMANMLISGTERPEMKTLADNVISSQSKEIAMMKGWLGDWYK